MHTLENPATRWRGIIALAATVFLCLGAAIMTAPSAEAQTFYVKPAKSWACKYLNWCKTGTYCYQGNPNIAYNKTVPKWRCYTVRY